MPVTQNLNSENYQSLVYKFAHDLRAPLMSVKGLIYLIQIESEVNQRIKYFDSLGTCIERMNKTIDVAILEATSDPLAHQVESICFRQIAEDTISSLQFMEEAWTVEINLFVEGQDTFFSNQQNLNSIFCNLISNAIRYRDKNKKSFLNIIIKLIDGHAEIVFEDNGIGIDEKHQHKIFDKFFCVDFDKQGTGLGLHIVQNCVQAIKGKLSLKSTPGVGSTFTLLVANQVKKGGI